MLRSTHTYATHQIPLECDVYHHDAPASPVLLFFHSRALTAGSRRDIPPWLVQACVQNQWPLVSASYRLLPQADGNDLVEDAAAAYAFARVLGGSDRPVIVAGASAGFFMAALVAHHCSPKPLALLSITGIPTFRHPFYASSTQLSPAPVDRRHVEHLLSGPVAVGTSPFFVFEPPMLQAGSWRRNPDYPIPDPPNRGFDCHGQNPARGSLYDYYVGSNAYGPLLAAVDPGFGWAATDADRLAAWPVTVFVHGDADPDVPLEISASVADALGPEKAKLCVAAGQDHLFENGSFLEDEGPGMDAVRRAVEELGGVVKGRDAVSAQGN